MKIEIDFDAPDGWKFARFDYPKNDEYYYDLALNVIYQASHDHSITKKFILEKLPKLKKYTFIETGEFRPIKEGEGYRNSDSSEFCIWKSNAPSLGCFLIYKVVIEDV